MSAKSVSPTVFSASPAPSPTGLMRECGGGAGWQKHAPWRRIVVYNNATIPQGASHGVYCTHDRQRDSYPVADCATEFSGSLHAGTGPAASSERDVAAGGAAQSGSDGDPGQSSLGVGH